MFDVRPEDMPQQPAVAATATATAFAPPVSSTAAIIQTDIARIIAGFGLDSIAPPVITPVYPPKFKLRLEKAMEKSIDYILRLDAGEISGGSVPDDTRVKHVKPAIFNSAVQRPGNIAVIIFRSSFQPASIRRNWIGGGAAASHPRQKVQRVY